MREKDPLPTEYLKIDRRYRESKYFFLDQLRYSASINDVRSIKDAIARSSQFSVSNRAFQFARVTLPIDP